jgi:hypothetical protein
MNLVEADAGPAKHNTAAAETATSEPNARAI